MNKINKVLWVIYLAMSVVITAGTVLYCTVEKVRNWINLHVVFPYVRGCERFEENYVDWCEKEEADNEEEE